MYLRFSLIAKFSNSSYSVGLSRAILITGGNGALGRAMARAFLADGDGCVVYLGVRRKK
jgi:NADP-dependent 3-hydroxy acid dehydrogenase YdfG